MTTTKAYDDLVEQKRTELRGHKHTQLTESECKQEIEAITGIVTIEPIPIITPTGPELDVMARTILAPKKRGRPKGSHNKSKAEKP